MDRVTLQMARFPGPGDDLEVERGRPAAWPRSVEHEPEPETAVEGSPKTRIGLRTPGFVPFVAPEEPSAENRPAGRRTEVSLP